MKLKTSETYKKEILDLYLKERGGDLSMYLIDPTPSGIREACLLLWENGMSKTDKEVLLRYLEVKEPFDKGQLSKFDLDKFKPIRSFLKQETSSPKSPTLEMIAWLVDFEHRPYSNYFKEKPISKHNNTVETVSNHVFKEENQVFSQRDKESISNKKTTTRKRFLKFLFPIVSVILFLGLLYWKMTLPFSTIINITKNPNLNLHSEYPIFNKEKEATFQLYLSTGILKREISSDGEVILVGLPPYLENETVKVLLNSNYWKLVKDSIVMKEGEVELYVVPNQSLSRIQGRIFNHIGGSPIENAIIKTRDMETFSDRNGIFGFTVPIEKRRSRYDLNIYKEGYEVYTKTYYPGTEIKVGLQSKN